MLEYKPEYPGYRFKNINLNIQDIDVGMIPMLRLDSSRPSIV